MNIIYIISFIIGMLIGYSILGPFILFLKEKFFPAKENKKL